MMYSSLLIVKKETGLETNVNGDALHVIPEVEIIKDYCFLRNYLCFNKT